MDPLTLGLIGSGVGFMKSQDDRKQNQADNRRNAIEKAYSTYADYTPGKVKEYNPWGDMAQFGVAGAGMGQSLENSESDKALKTAQTGAYNRYSGNPGNQVNVVNAQPTAAVPVQQAYPWKLSQKSLGNSPSFDPNWSRVGQMGPSTPVGD